jgi:spore photoproduct lyase
LSLFIVAANYKEAAPLIALLKLKKDMTARPFDLFRREGFVLCLCGKGAANHSTAIGWLAGKYGVTRDGGHKLLYLREGQTLRLPHTLRDAASGAACYPEPHAAIASGMLDSHEAVALFEAAARFFMLKDIIPAETPPDYDASEIFALTEASFTPAYSFVYAEEAAFGYPLTERVLERLPNAAVVPVKHYKDIFNRSGQDFDTQKESPKLILAVREKNFIFEGSGLCDNFGHSRFFYSTQMMNCPYHCEYCYLRGMYPSANIVAFVNVEDYFAQARVLGEAYLSVSYDSDLLAREPLFGYGAGWAEFARRTPGLTVELRTKSVNLPDCPSSDNVILCWTVSPKGTALYEHKAPSVSARLKAARKALDAGWRVRLQTEPVLPLGEWEQDYTKLQDEIREVLDVSRLEGIGTDTFRMPETYYRRIRKQGVPLFDELPVTLRDGVVYCGNAPPKAYSTSGVTPLSNVSSVIILRNSSKGLILCQRKHQL